MKSLNWYLNPPTPSTFVDVLSPIMGEITNDEDITAEIKDNAKYLLELSVCDGYFVRKHPSLIGHAAIIVAMKILGTPRNIQMRIYQSLPTSASSTSIEDCALRLQQIYDASVTEHELRSSPTSVFANLSD